MRKRLVVYSTFLASLSLAFGQNEDLFHKGIESYNTGNYSEAISHYESILENGEHSAALYFNLGNCYYKMNRIAPSIYYYEKALLLDPNDEEIQNNLTFARQMTLDAIEEMPETGLAKIYNSTTRALSYEQWGLLSLIFVGLGIVGYIVYYLLGYATYKRIAFTASLVLMIMGFAFVAFAYIGQRDYKKDQPAIIFAEAITVRSEPNRRSEPVFELHEGTKVLVLDQLEDWNKIQLANGQEGWLPESEIRLLKDF